MARPRAPLLMPLALAALLSGAGAAAGQPGDLGALREAARQGSEDAWLELGTRLLAGPDEADWAEAVSWLEKAARGGAPVYILIADSWAEGLGVPRDPVRAAEWYRIGAETGDGLAQYEIGRRYLEGDGVEIDMVRAVFYLELALTRLRDDTLRAEVEDTLIRARWWTGPKDREDIRRMVRDWKPKSLVELIN